MIRSFLPVSLFVAVIGLFGSRDIVAGSPEALASAQAAIDSPASPRPSDADNADKWSAYYNNMDARVTALTAERNRLIAEKRRLEAEIANPSPDYSSVRAPAATPSSRPSSRPEARTRLDQAEVDAIESRNSARHASISEQERELGSSDEYDRVKSEISRKEAELKELENTSKEGKKLYRQAESKRALCSQIHTRMNSKVQKIKKAAEAQQKAGELF